MILDKILENPEPYFELSNQQKLDWLRLIRSENVGPATFRDLINHFGSAGAALDVIPELSAKGGRKSLKICEVHRAEAELEAAGKLGIRYVTLAEPDYPEPLRFIDAPPPVLSIYGNPQCCKHPTLGIVGSRNASMSGIKLAHHFAEQLASADFTVVSGFARGIDTAAHKASIDAHSIAVMAGGVDVVFPPENEALYKDFIEQENLILSEMPLHWRPRAVDFPRRNRIIAGLSLAVLVVEAAKRSGSLITARLTNEMGREVFAIPGSPLDPRSSGTNALIRQGATLVSEPSHITESLNRLVENPENPTFFKPVKQKSRFSLFEKDHEQSAPFCADDLELTASTMQGLRQQIIQLLGPTPTEIDDLVAHSGGTISQVQLILLELDLAGRLERHSGNKVSILLAP